MNHTRMSEKRHELLADLASLAERLFLEYEIPSAAANVVANALADHLADHWGGQNITFPKDFRWKLSKVELDIYDQFTGRNYDVLAKHHHMTERGVRKLIDRVRRRLQNRNQAGLFDVPDEQLQG